jgi:hypothetical protein
MSRRIWKFVDICSPVFLGELDTEIDVRKQTRTNSVSALENMLPLNTILTGKPPSLSHIIINNQRYFYL